FYLVMATLPLVLAIHGGNSAGGFIHTWFSIALCSFSAAIIWITPISCCIEGGCDPEDYSPDRSSLVTAMGGWWFIISSAVAIGNTFMYVQCENDTLGQAPTIRKRDPLGSGGRFVFANKSNYLQD
ncbi:2116_t:CDS:2, partial [Racocetra fulgida]